MNLEGEDEEGLKRKEEECAELLEFLQKALDEHIKQVRLTNRLAASPICLVVEEHYYSPNLEKLLQMGRGGIPKHWRVLELNTNHQKFYLYLSCRIFATLKAYRGFPSTLSFPSLKSFMPSRSGSARNL